MKAFIFLLILAAVSSVQAQHRHGPAAPTTEKPLVWLDNGLGNIDHPVTTRSAEAQKYFNQGLAYLFAFNHAEGINSFKQAAELDPEMAMAYWGIALALGSNYNVTADETQLVEAYANLQKAVSLAPKMSQADQDYIAALSKRYAADPKTDRTKLANDYKIAMGELVKKYPDDLDAATLYAESMMNLRPWQLWSLDGKPAEGTLEIIAVLEGVLKRNPNHTGANHYYIHAIEASPNPERALASAYRLGGLAPSAGHLVHMPSHIYLRTGDWQAAVKSNDAAILADRTYLQRSGATGVYPLMYYNHNIHMLAASHVGNGNYAGALKASRELEANVAPNLKAMPMLEMFMPYTLVTMVRFHKSEEILKYPQPALELKVTNAYWRLARGLALTDLGKPREAEKELAELRVIMKSTPFDAGIGNSLAQNVLKTAELMLEGEIILAKGNKAAAVETLRRAVAAEDLVNYNEPPDFDIPVREWLGRALLRSGRPAEAESVFREEIGKHPKNGRALFGLAEALNKQGKTTAAGLVRREFEAAWRDADTTLTVAELYGSSQTGSALVRTSKVVSLKTGVRIRYVEQGNPNGKPVILLHGITDSAFSFSRVMPLLDLGKFRVLALDQRGHGESDKPNDGYALTNFAADVAAFMDAAGIRRATIVGHSMGSFVAMQTAISYPQRVDGLVLVGSATTVDTDFGREFKNTVDGLNDPIALDFVREFQKSTLYREVPANFFEQAVQESLKVPANVWKKALDGLISSRIADELDKIKVPVLVIWGDKENIFPRSEQDKLISKLWQAKLKVYTNAGHSPNWEYPELFARDLEEFLGRNN